MEEEKRRAFGRIMDAAREAKLSMGPVILPEDFESHPYVLADLFDQALDRPLDSDLAKLPISVLDSAEDELSSARSAVDDALYNVREALRRLRDTARRVA